MAWGTADLEVGEIRRNWKEREKEQPVNSNSGSQSAVQGPVAAASPALVRGAECQAAPPALLPQTHQG